MSAILHMKKEGGTILFRRNAIFPYGQGSRKGRVDQISFYLQGEENAI